jgi:hypothetical protein
MSRPIGIADLILQPLAGAPTPDHWYWCRIHEKAEHVSDPVIRKHVPFGDKTRVTVACIRIGPFMSDTEAQRLSRGGTEGRPIDPLGMDVE